MLTNNDLVKGLATIEKVTEVIPHNNADKLEMIKVLGYTVISQKGLYKTGDLCVFIRPDSCVPVDKEWSQEVIKYMKSSDDHRRVRAIKLRGEWSYGLVMPLSVLGDGNHKVGTDVTEYLGLYKYSLPVKLNSPTNNNSGACGGLPYGIPKTDETNYKNFPESSIVNRYYYVTEKRDGSSFTAYGVVKPLTLKQKIHSFFRPHLKSEYLYKNIETGVCSRSLNLKLDTENVWTDAFKKYKLDALLRKLVASSNYICSVALRGELVGKGINKSTPNKDAELTQTHLIMFDLLLKEGNNNWETQEFTALKCMSDGLQSLGIDVVREPWQGPVLIKSMDDIREIEKDFEGFMGDLEGVVLKEAYQPNPISFKVMNLNYDEKK